MASPEVLDFAALLAPIPGDHPAGMDVRTDPTPMSLYQMIREDRKAASALEKQAATVEGPPAPIPQWQSLIDKAKRVLAEKSKDMEVTSYVIEGLTRKNGFAGLRDGYRLARELLVQYWDGLFPSHTDPPDLESRFSHLLQLNGDEKPGALVVPIRMIPFTEPTSVGCFSLAHHYLAKSLTRKDPKVRQTLINGGAVTLEMIAMGVAETSAEFYANLVDDLRQSQEEFGKFCAVLREKSGYDPPSSYVQEVLEEYLGVVKDLARDKIPEPPPPPVPPVKETGSTEETGPLQTAPAKPGAIGGREDALQRLEQIAAYFRASEPQSIIPYALQQVITWGRMPLPKLLAELIPEENTRKGLFEKVGIKPGDSA